MSCRVAGGFRGCSSTFVACVAVFRHSHLLLPQVRKNQAVLHDFYMQWVPRFAHTRGSLSTVRFVCVKVPSPLHVEVTAGGGSAICW